MSAQGRTHYGYNMIGQELSGHEKKWISCCHHPAASESMIRRLRISFLNVLTYFQYQMEVIDA
jgi:hypothetical protein